MRVPADQREGEQDDKTPDEDQPHVAAGDLRLRKPALVSTGQDAVEDPAVAALRNRRPSSAFAKKTDT